MLCITDGFHLYPLSCCRRFLGYITTTHDIFFRIRFIANQGARDAHDRVVGNMSPRFLAIRQMRIFWRGQGFASRQNRALKMCKRLIWLGRLKVVVSAGVIRPVNDDMVNTFFLLSPCALRTARSPPPSFGHIPLVSS